MTSGLLSKFDIENPHRAGAKLEADDSSTSTHPSESSSDSGIDTAHRQRHGFGVGKQLLLIFLILFLGIFLGVGFGLTISRQGAELTSNEINDERTESGNSSGHESIPDQDKQENSSPSQQELTSDDSGVMHNFAGENPNISVETPTSHTVDEIVDESSFETKPPVSLANGGSLGNGIPDGIGWPQLIGIPVEEAKKFIEALDRGYNVIIVPPNGFTTKDYQRDRVWIFEDKHGLVAREPRPGR